MSVVFPSIRELGHRELLAHDFALINPMRVAAGRWKDLPVVPLRAPAFSAQPHLVPQLLSLAALDDDTRFELLDRNSRQCRETGLPMFCALLAGELQASVMAAILGRQMLVLEPAGATAWLRFHDPRVFSALTWWLEPAQLKCLFGPVRIWTWPEPRDGRWHHLARPELPLPAASRITLTHDQAGRLQRQPLVNRCLRQLGARDPLRARVERVDGHLCSALASGMVLDRDLCRYAIQAERQGHSRIEEPA